MNQEKVFDELLVMKCQQGDNHALELIMKRWHKRLVSFAYKYTHDVDSARDIVQESWVAVYRSVHKLKEPDKFGTWLYRLCFNKCMDYLRKVKKYNEVEIDGKVEVKSEPEKCDDQWSVLSAILQQLPVSQKTILTLFYLEEQSIKQIAEILQLAEGTVKSRIFYARELLKQKYKEVNNEKF